MLNSVVSTGNMVVGQLVAGVLNLSLDHPFVLCATIAAMAGASCAVLLDTIAPRLSRP